jgi:hypothetical protein
MPMIDAVLHWIAWAQQGLYQGLIQPVLFEFGLDAV